jgi:hypothetical protein
MMQMRWAHLEDDVSEKLLTIFFGSEAAQHFGRLQQVEANRLV